MSDAIPLFPLGTLLFPRGRISLQIFEPRYMDMVKSCLRKGVGFGIVGLKSGSESVQAGVAIPKIYTTGVLAHIVDWHGLEHGRIGIVVEGSKRFSVQATSVQDDYLMLGDVEFLPEEQDDKLPTAHADLAGLLKQLAAHPSVAQTGVSFDYTSSACVAYCLAQLLPIPAEEKYELMCCDSVANVLARITLITDRLSGREP
ncbi:MAG: LON peptidase substrate-binding domain-containing protein [Pseudomonadales bacterium]